MASFAAYTAGEDKIRFSDDNTYLDDLKSATKPFGYDEEIITALMKEGFTPDEIEEYLYCRE